MNITTVRTEKEIQDLIANNFKEYFDCELIKRECRLSNNKIVDFLGRKDGVDYLIEIKRNAIDKYALEQMATYLSTYKDQNKCVGVLCTPVKSNVKINHKNLIVKVLENIYAPPLRVDVSSTLNKNLLLQFDEFSKKTRIPKTKLLDEAISDLLVKYGYKEPIK